ncbi:MAG TPA: alpha-amylase family glycosyl hydrolase, partial [Thermoleophilia bacterium]|nr:alpha-amylase family glycosyl hydrolase [Thermoleophilia bacterium]
MRTRRLPAATYRLQLGPQLDFMRARALLPYLQSLGITTVYISPLLQSVRGGHGYDVTDPRRPNDALGTAEDLRRLCGSAAAAEMDIVVDIVPNHMAASLENPFWRDVIEKGRGSLHADIFAIDWDAPEARGKLVLPVLHSDMDDLMVAGEVRLEWSDAEGEFILACGGLRFPVSPWSYRAILSPSVTDDESFLEQVSDSGRSHDARASEMC